MGAPDCIILDKELGKWRQREKRGKKPNKLRILEVEKRLMAVSSNSELREYPTTLFIGYMNKENWAYLLDNLVTEEVRRKLLIRLWNEGFGWT